MRAPLTAPKIREIADRYADNPDIDSLLWEVERLQMKLRHVYDDLHEDRNMSRGEIRRMRHYMRSEPCVQEHVDGQPSLF